MEDFRPRAETSWTVKRPSLLLAAIVGALAFAGSAAASNPFGITVVRFAPGTPPSEMRSAVFSVGGVVVDDLSQISALAAASSTTGFAERIRRNPAVLAAFQDALLVNDQGDVNQHGGGRAPDGDGDGGTGGSFPDPWHELPSFLGVTNPEGILQWDDNRMRVPGAWSTTTGDRSIVVAVLDTGVDASHRELQSVVDRRLGGNFIPCDDLRALFGLGYIDRAGLRDCRDGDFEGHGTWVASRIAGAANGFGSNGVAPGVRIASYKVLAAGFGGLASWILSGLVSACSSSDVDLVNMSIEGYLDPSDPFDAQVYGLVADAVSYCRSRGIAVFGAAGNAHVRVDRVNIAVGGRSFQGVGRVSLGSEGIASVTPGAPLAPFDLRGLLEVPAGVPGVTMVSSTANAIGEAPPWIPLRWTDHVGARDQLAYYSNYGSRVDLAAPGGARRYEIPLYDGGDGDILYGGWGSFGALNDKGLICTNPVTSALFNSACFKLAGQGFGWLQGTSMSSPNAVGVAALTLSARHNLVGRPDALLARLQSTANQGPVNFMGPNDPANFAPSLAGVPCTTGYCHVDQAHPVPFADAYGAGLVDADAAVGH
jgi:subtilisin family serine protease